jgi:hypothetical protein
MKNRPIAFAAAVVSLLAIAPAANACGTSDPYDPPCVTRVESGWSFHSELHDTAVRTRVQAWQWVWDDASGQWVWGQVTVETANHDQDQRQDFQQWSTSVSGSAWNWNW